jgi:hypothetical protein
LIRPCWYLRSVILIVAALGIVILPLGVDRVRVASMRLTRRQVSVAYGLILRLRLRHVAKLALPLSLSPFTAPSGATGAFAVERFRGPGGRIAAVV